GASRPGAPRLATVGPEGPEVALRVGSDELVVAVVLVGRFARDGRAGGTGPLVDLLDVVGDHVATERARLTGPLAVRLVGPEHDAAALGPVELGVGDLVAVGVHRGLDESEGLHQELDQRRAVPSLQGGPDSGCGGVLAHVPHSGPFRCPPAWMFRRSSASQPLGGTPARSRNSRTRCGWSK